MTLLHYFIRNRFGLIIFQLIITTVKIYGQTGSEYLPNQNRIFNANLMTPQSFSFTKYGGHTASLSTGELNLQIPIYTYQDADFQIPISMGYGSAGFMPNQRESILGLGWYLSGGGGAVTRVVNGVPDDSRSLKAPLSGYYDLDGLYYGIKNNLAVKSTGKASIFNLTAGVINSNWYWHIGYCEVDPDLFSFNVPGLSGKFYLQNSGEVRCIGSKPFKVDLSGVSIQYYDGTPQDNVLSSAITITTDDGYEYQFGGTMRYLDVVFTLNGENQATSPLINSWHLTKITAPNGRTIDYVYKNFNQGIHQDEIPDDSYHYLYSVNTIRAQFSNQTSYSSGAYELSGISSLEDVRSATKTTYLEKITIDGRASISFDYAERDYKFYTDAYNINQPFNQKNYCLKRIEVSEFEGEKRKEFEFTHAYYGGTYKRMFLTAFQEKGVNPYSFSYYETTSLPTPITGAVDHWGFWNATSNTHGSTIPMSTYHVNGDVEITGNERDANTSKSQTSMLYQITYPTLGYSRFHYEGHQYAKRLERRNDYDFLPKLYNVTGYAGGARISKIEEYNGNTLNTVREFKYTKGYPSGSGSSGILMRWPRYIFYWEVNNAVGHAKYLQSRSTSFNSAYSGVENYIQYSEVTEVEKDNGYTVNKFTSYETNPDENDYRTRILDETFYPSVSNAHLWNSYVGIKFNDKYFERGVPWHVQRFKNNGSGQGILIHETKTTAFTSLSDFPDSYLVGTHLTGGIVQSFKRYYYPFLPKVVLETSYDDLGQNPVNIERQYQYNSQGYTIKEYTKKSSGEAIVSATSYPLEYTNGTSFIDDMKTRNLFAYPIEQVQYKEVGTIRTILSGQIFKYKIGGKGQLDQVLQLEPEGSLSVASIIPPSGTPAAFSPDSRYKVSLTYDNYDTYGNLLQYTVADGVPISYLWGYSGRYPIAEVRNALQNDIAYTSFESDGKGNWSYSGTPLIVDAVPTGKQAYMLSAQNALTKGGLTPTKRYVVSYWREGGNSGSVSVSGTQTTVTGETIKGWTYEEKIISAVSTVTVNGNIRIDEIRLYPEDSQMTTYTHHPLKGMTSGSAASGLTTYYEYDFYDRLKAIRDQDRKIKEAYDYHYKNQN